IVVAGSFHERKGDSPPPFSHIAPVWARSHVAPQFSAILNYEKLAPWDDDVLDCAKYSELADIVAAAQRESAVVIREDVAFPEIRVRCIVTAIGVIGFAICRDLLVPELATRY